MFFVKLIEHEVVLEPKYFGPKLYDTVDKLVRDSVEGQALSHYGYVVRVLNVPREEMKRGVIGTEKAAFVKQKFAACHVQKCVNFQSALSNPCPPFMLLTHAPRAEYDTGDVCYKVKYEALLFRPFKNEVIDAVVTNVVEIGLFAHVGPLRVFVSQHLFTPDLNGSDGEGGGFKGDQNAWVSGDNEVHIKEGCGLRLKIMGVTVEDNNIQAVGTFNDDYLGMIDTGADTI